MKKTLQDTTLLPSTAALSPFQVALTKLGEDARIPFDAFKAKVLEGVPTVVGPQGPQGPKGDTGSSGASNTGENLTKQIPYLNGATITQATLENAFKLGNNAAILTGFYTAIFKCNSANPVNSTANLTYTIQGNAATIAVFEGACMEFGFTNGALTYVEMLNTRQLIDKVLALETTQVPPAAPVLSRDFPIHANLASAFSIWGRGESTQSIVAYDFIADFKTNSNLLAFINDTGKTVRFKTIEITIVNIQQVVNANGELTILIPRGFTKVTFEGAQYNGDEFRASFPRVSLANVSASNVSEQTPFEYISDASVPKTFWIDTNDTDQPTYIRLFDLKAYSRLQIYLDFGG